MICGKELKRWRELTGAIGISSLYHQLIRNSRKQIGDGDLSFRGINLLRKPRIKATSNWKSSHILIILNLVTFLLYAGKEPDRAPQHWDSWLEDPIWPWPYHLRLAWPQCCGVLQAKYICPLWSNSWYPERESRHRTQSPQLGFLDTNPNSLWERRPCYNSVYGRIHLKRHNWWLPFLLLYNH